MHEKDNGLTHKEKIELKGFFISEAESILLEIKLINKQLENIEDKTEIKKLFKHLRRNFHTLKGNSASVGFSNINSVSLRLEGILDYYLIKKIFTVEDISSILHESTVIINQLLTFNDKNTTRFRALLEKLDSIDISSEKENMEIPSVKTELSKKERIEILNALKSHLRIYEARISFNKECHEKAIAAFMIAKHVNSVGKLLASIPDINKSQELISCELTVIFTSELDESVLANKINVIGITEDISISPYSVDLGEENLFEKDKHTQ